MESFCIYLSPSPLDAFARSSPNAQVMPPTLKNAIEANDYQRHLLGFLKVFHLSSRICLLPDERSQRRCSPSAADAFADLNPAFNETFVFQVSLTETGSHGECSWKCVTYKLQPVVGPGPLLLNRSNALDLGHRWSYKVLAQSRAFCFVYRSKRHLYHNEIQNKIVRFRTDCFISHCRSVPSPWCRERCASWCSTSTWIGSTGQ